VVFILPRKLREDVLNRDSFAYSSTEYNHDIMSHDSQDMLEVL